MKEVVVRMGECRCTSDPAAELATYSLGSCIAVALHDPVATIGGLIHFVLPDSRIDRQEAEANPYMFADTGVPLLFRRMRRMGADSGRLTVRVAGGAQVWKDASRFNIGRRNYLALRKLLWDAGTMIHAERVGGDTWRAVRLHVGSGGIVWHKANESEREPGPETSLDENRLTSCRALVVDDSAAMRGFIRRAMELCGFHGSACLEAGNGNEALNVLDREKVDIILTDINMPEMDGEELVFRLAMNGSLHSTPLVVISPDATEMKIRQMISMGASGYIIKPFVPERLRLELDRVLGGIRD